VLDLLVVRPCRAITPTEAVVFRKIEADKPTLLLDEADAILGPKAREHEVSALSSTPATGMARRCRAPSACR
jgi:hypothetical protein